MVIRLGSFVLFESRSQLQLQNQLLKLQILQQNTIIMGVIHKANSQKGQKTFVKSLNTFLSIWLHTNKNNHLNTRIEAFTVPFNILKVWDESKKTYLTRVCLCWDYCYQSIICVYLYWFLILIVLVILNIMNAWTEINEILNVNNEYELYEFKRQCPDPNVVCVKVLYYTRFKDKISSPIATIFLSL